MSLILAPLRARLNWLTAPKILTRFMPIQARKAGISCKPYWLIIMILGYAREMIDNTSASETTKQLDAATDT